ncbi:glutaredoxin-C1-like [Panicum miliaceum]|uniref:Glutaredoxin-C1-like n=1 Tax=Panicum miliaceum TaxID=4540 RepID=A0A3L6TL14_PANMI|nr:glutaredoxin-C1-like [Panicum miliaceum]
MEAVVARLASESAVVVFSVSSCGMCHAVKRLLRGLGASPAVHELDEDPRGREIERALAGIAGRRRSGPAPVVPAVFIGGAYVGPMEAVMSLHIGGRLVPMLRSAGAIWL